MSDVEKKCDQYPGPPAHTEAGKTTIMYGGLDPKTGALVVEFYEDPKWIMSWQEIANKIKNKPGKLPVQDQPFWTTVDSRHRLVFTLQIPNWYFPCLSDMQQGKLPFTLISEDPQDDYKRPQIMSVRNIEGGDDKRIKTCYVDYVGDWQTIPFTFDLNVYIWQDPSQVGCFKTPIVIDPGTGGPRGVP